MPLLQNCADHGRIGGNKAREMLWNKIDFPDKVVVTNVLLALGKQVSKAGVSQITRVKYTIETDIADVSWNLNAIREVGDDNEVSD